MIQDLIDKTSYPPTHIYNVVSLKPSGPLADRVRIINRMAPGFFETSKDDAWFLDIGCNKGYFSMRASRGGYNVEGIDPGAEFINICNQLPTKYADFKNVPFSQYTINNIHFDRVFVGNVHHYLFQDCDKTWNWIKKLALYTREGSQVIVEGPEADCRDLNNIIMDEDERDTYATFEAEMAPYFTLEDKSSSPPYTPERSIWLFTRKRGLQDCPVDRSDLAQTVDIVTTPKRKFFITQYNGQDCFAKVYVGEDIVPPLNALIAASSPHSNGLVALIRGTGGDIVGWLEPLLDLEKHPPFRYFPGIENEREIILTFAKHQLLLLNLGYIDIDPGSINYFRDTDGALKTFDKNTTMPISRLNAGLNERNMQCYRQSFSTFSELELLAINMALDLKNQPALKRLFQLIHDERVSP